MLILGYLCICIKWYHKYQKLAKSAYHPLHCDPAINLGWVRSDPIYFLMCNLDAGYRFRLAEETLTRISHPKLYTYKWTSARKLHSLFSRPFPLSPFSTFYLKLPRLLSSQSWKPSAISIIQKNYKQWGWLGLLLTQWVKMQVTDDRLVLNSFPS